MKTALFTATLVLLAGCGGDDPMTQDPGGNVLLKDMNNFTCMGTLSVPTVETAPGVDLDVCWDKLTSDIQCHTVAPQADLDNVAMLRFRLLSEDQVETKLSSGQLAMSEVDGYLDYHTDHTATCMKLSQLSFFGTQIKVAEEYVESTERTYMLLFAEGTLPGLGARAMTFVKPTATSNNVRVDAPVGCGMLDFSADLMSAVPVNVPAVGPWLVDWRAVTRDGQGNPIAAGSIDGMLIGFYEGQTVAEIQAKIFDLELLATTLWEVELTGGRTADLETAKERGSGAAFPGFARSTTGTWLLGLTCSTCQNPAPLVLAILNPGSGS